MGQCSARVSTRSPVSANWPLAEMLVLYQGPGGWWSLQGRAKGCQSETASKGDRWPGGSWENQGLKRLRDAHQDSADNQFCGPTAQTGTPIQGQILVEGSSKHGQALRSSVLLVSIGHPALAGGCLEAVWAGGSLPTTPPRQLLLAVEGLQCPACLWGSPGKGETAGWAGRWHHPDVGVTAARPAVLLWQWDSQSRAGCIFQFGSAPSHPPSFIKSCEMPAGFPSSPALEGMRGPQQPLQESHAVSGVGTVAATERCLHL